MENEKGKQFSVMNDEPFMEFMTEKFGKIDEQFEKIDERFNQIESKMVTKSFLTEKLVDLKVDFNLKIKKEDSKVNLLADILEDKKVIQGEDVMRLKEIEVFPAL